MSKRAKRVIFVILLTVILFVFGYPVFSCNNFRDGRVSWSELDGGMYIDLEAERELTLEGDRAALRIGIDIYQLTVRRYEGGILVVGADAEEFVFGVQAPNRLYCGQLNAYLYRA